MICKVDVMAQRCERRYSKGVRETPDRAKRESAMKNIAKVCGNCFVAIRTGEYEPDGGTFDTCAVCNDLTMVHRITRAEVRAEIARIAGDAEWAEIVAETKAAEAIRNL